MAGSRSAQKLESLALATSRIHRSCSFDELQKTFFSIAPKFTDADAYGMYLLDNKLNMVATFSYHADQKFLSEYEKLRNNDPLFNCLLKKKKFVHSFDMFDRHEWQKEPLHAFLAKWGLDYSIEAPLVIDGHVKGTLNIAKSGSKYFDQSSLISARFLCNEIDVAYKRICEIDALKTEIARLRTPAFEMDSLSNREREVLELAIIGLSNRVISCRLGISENTVRHHLKQLYRALDVHNRVQLLRRVHSMRSSVKRN